MRQFILLVAQSAPYCQGRKHGSTHSFHWNPFKIHGKWYGVRVRTCYLTRSTTYIRTLLSCVCVHALTKCANRHSIIHIVEEMYEPLPYEKSHSHRVVVAWTLNFWGVSYFRMFLCDYCINCMILLSERWNDANSNSSTKKKTDRASQCTWTICI